MEQKHLEFEYEAKRLEQTISLASKQLKKARESNEENKADIIAAKKELRENTSHSISNLWNAEQFEALAELGQYVNPVLDKIADYEEVENKILRLENLIKSPYFARIDFKFDEEDAFEEIYIGRTSLKDEKTHEMYIYDWRSPIASVFYRFVTGEVYYDAPVGRISGEVNKKRQYEIKNGILEYFFDADVQIIDEFLRKLLSQNTSNKMKTIVETIQKEQDIVIRDMENDLMMVQGVAGSGKTSIALHRTAYLMYQGLTNKLSANNIIIISPNSLFEQYIENVLPELGEHHVQSLIFEEIMSLVLHQDKIQSRNQFLETLITSDRYRTVIKRSIELKTSLQFLEILNRFVEDLPNRWIAFEDVYYKGKFIIGKEKLKEKIVGRVNTPLGMKLEQLEEYVLELIEENCGRISKGEEARIKNELLSFTKLSIKTLYFELFKDKEYFNYLAKNRMSFEHLDEIFKYTNENSNSSWLYYDDAIALSYLTLKIYGSNEYRTIKQVVVDEAQDYYPLQYEIFRILFLDSKFTILGDMNQTLEKQEDITLYEQIKTILNKKKATLITMDKSFRCTNEILNYSMKFIDQTTKIKSFNREGEKPEVHVFYNQELYCNKIIEEIAYCQRKDYQSIGLICKSEKSALVLYDMLKDYVDLQLIKNESTCDLQGVFIIPVYMSKGLEFDAVLVCDTDKKNYESEDDKKLLYIACTRALHRLNLFCQNEISPLLV